MPAKINASDTIALLCSLDAKFENSFKKRNDFFNTHYKITIAYGRLLFRVYTRSLILNVFDDRNSAVSLV